MEPFSKLAIEYITLYKKNSINSVLQNEALQALDYFKCNNYKQIIISAIKQRSFEKQVKDNEVYHYFESIIGLDNIHAKKKNRKCKKLFTGNPAVFISRNI